MATWASDSYNRKNTERAKTSAYPSHLPRIDPPLFYDSFRSDSNLRRDSYETVPPVKTHRHYRTYRPDEDQDSWGEPEYSSDEENYQITAPYTADSYQIAAPYPVLYLYPSPYIAAAPQHQWIPVKQPLQKKQVRYREEPVILQGKTPTQSSIEYNSPPQSRHNKHYNPFDPRQNPLLIKYQNSFLDGKKNRNGFRVAVQHFENNRSFREAFVNSLISDYLEETFVPDLLIDVMSTRFQQLPRSSCYFLPSYTVSLDFLDEEIPPIVQSVIQETVRELAVEYVAGQTKADAAERIYDGVLGGLIKEEATKVVRSYIKEFAESHLERAAAYDVIMSVVDEIIMELGPYLEKEGKHEAFLELILDELLNSELERMEADVAMETLSQLHDKMRENNIRMISKYAKERLLDGIMLEHLIASVARQGRVSTKEHTEEVALDGMMISVLLEQQFALIREPKLTTESKAISRFHEKAFNELALDVILTSLTDSLTEDMNDLDEYEQGLWNPKSSLPPEWAVLLEDNNE